MKIGKADGLIQAILGAGLVAAIVWSCRPADAVDLSGHDAARCEVCRHPNSRPGEAPGAHLMLRMAAKHLETCGACRAAGLTPAKMVAMDTPTPCVHNAGDGVR